MNSINEELIKLRKNKNYNIDYTNTNRHAVVFNEDDFSKTAYYFSAPIYNLKNRKIVDLVYEQKGSTVTFDGSNSKVTLTNVLSIKNNDGEAIIKLPNKISGVSRKKVFMSRDEITPTLNGFLYTAQCNNGRFVFEISVDKPFQNIRTNSKYFALMIDKFRPFITVSSVGTVDSMNRIIAPARLSYYKINSTSFGIVIQPRNIYERVCVEVNLYEDKLSQDTTVESMNQDENNTFGSVAFIGRTPEFGEQWLYSRLVTSKISNLDNQQINTAVLYLPKLSESNSSFNAFRIPTRFCSFASNWRNKKTQSSYISTSVNEEDYYKIDLKSLMTTQDGTLAQSEGFILKPEKNLEEYALIPTGDCYFAPQIFEINYSKKIFNR